MLKQAQRSLSFNTKRRLGWHHHIQAFFWYDNHHKIRSAKITGYNSTVSVILKQAKGAFINYDQVGVM